MKFKVNELLVFVILFLSITNFGNLVFLYFGLRPSHFTVFACSILFIYTIIKKIGKSQILAILMLLIFPVLTEIINLEFAIREYGLYLYYAVIFLTTFIFIKENKEFLLVKVINWSLFCISLFTIITFIYPAITDNFINLYFQEQRPINDLRAYGPFLQPNMTASALVLGIMALEILNKTNNKILILCVAIIILTGSRGAILIIIIFVLYKYRFQFNKKGLIKAFGSLFILIGVVFVLFTFNEETFIRVSSIYNIFFLDQQDGSLDTRIDYFKSYFAYFNDTLIVGYGIVNEGSFRETGLLSGASHNSHLSIIFRYGLIYYLLYMLIFFMYPIFKHKRVSVLIFILIVYFNVINTLLLMSIYYILICLIYNKIKISDK